jgi:Holliday junction resolvasome RuvABC DNA-binding subunit
MRWLRWCDSHGQWLLTAAEAELAAERAAKETERAAKETERAAKETAQQQVRQGVHALFKLGLTVPQIAQAMGMTEAEVQAIADQ